MAVPELPIALPTLDRLGVASVPTDVDAEAVANLWLNTFAQRVATNDIDGLLSLLTDDAWWRDMLAFTWEFRTFHGQAKIRKFLQDRLDRTKSSAFKLTTARLENPYPDLAWILGQFSFETDVGLCSGIVRLVPTQEGRWLGFTFYTNMEDLKGHLENIGTRRNFQPNHGKWMEQRERERQFVDGDPAVLIIGGGQSGLDVAVRLKLLGVPVLVVEKNARVGDQWRNRYQALCLHDPVWYDHMPFIPFPPSWPVWTPAQKLAGWLEYYADAMEVDIWTSSTVTKAEQDENDEWDVTVEKADGSTRVFHVRHLVFAVGFAGNQPHIPSIPNREEYQGEVLHSLYHKSARDHLGKKVLVVGAATTAHDIAADYVDHGVDVTMYQRSSTCVVSTKEGMPRSLGRLWSENGLPTDVADRVNASMPLLLGEEMAKRTTKEIAEADKDILEGLKRVGFRTNMGIGGSGFVSLAWRIGGKFYLDVGASQLIIDGKIKLKSDSVIKRFTRTGFEFEDGSTIEADVILFATGFSGGMGPLPIITRICGPELAARVKPIWNLTDEGEIWTVWRDTGVPNLWVMLGNLAQGRFHSKHLALQIKAMEEGIFRREDRYI